MLKWFKRMLTVLGAGMSGKRLHQVQMLLNYMKLGRWMKKHGFRISTRYKHRHDVFDQVIAQVRDKEVLYLEFGVYKGDCTQYWSKALQHPKALLHGFDSFTGLPEDFDVEGPYQEGTFDLEGTIPQFDDPRVTMHKGWFDAVLPGYKVPQHETLVMIMDADLYSSTDFVLRHLRDEIRPGTFIYFDNMSRPDHEPRAFAEFMRDTGRKFRLVATDFSLNTSFFECVS